MTGALEAKFLGHILKHGVESWSGVEPWSGVVFWSGFFWSQNVCHLGSNDYLCLIPRLTEITRSTGF